MGKKIAAELILVLMLLSLLVIPFNVQPVRASTENPGYITTGADITVSVGVVTLTFADVTASGQLSVAVAPWYPPPPSPPPSDPPSAGTATASVASAGPPFLGVWDVTVTAKFTGSVTIGIHYGSLGGIPFHIFQSDPVLGDVNFDGKVNLADLVTIAKALGSTPGTPRWNPYCDLNGDGKVNLQDLCIALHNFGKTGNPTWTDITYNVDYPNEIIYGTTDHFSLFGVR
ncbi:MAG: dockerin type I repeat-containing protein [Candidatus Bathyarchaeia archaeon]|jgi:hypothetical protein